MAAEGTATPSRRVAAVVLPRLLCELAEPIRPPPSARRGHARAAPLGVVVGSAPSPGSAGEAEAPEAAPKIEETAVLSAVNDAAFRLGIRPGQTLAEAHALAARLRVHRLAASELERALGKLAEIALGFGATVSFAVPDTVWVDVTGSAHLFGGEAALLAELAGRVSEAGHRCRVAIAEGPDLARAFARFGAADAEGRVVVPSGRARFALEKLPVQALPLPPALVGLFVRLGLFTLGDLGRLPPGALALRLGQHAARALELLSGRDAAPLVAYTPPRVLAEELSWDEPSAGNEPLLFALRGLAARLGARLQGRGEGAEALKLTILADPALARFHGVPPQTTVELALPKPVWRENELRRLVGSKLERLALGAPSIGLKLEVTRLAEAVPRQLELGSLLGGASTATDELPLLVAELGADLGEGRVGVLGVIDSYRPERQSRLVPALPRSPLASARLKKTRPPLALRKATPTGQPTRRLPPTRLLPTPLEFDAPLQRGASVVVDHRLYSIQGLCFEQRLEAVEWWNKAIHRDYVRVLLEGSEGTWEALVYVDRETGRRYLQGIVH